jgi:hypothetical protein
MFASSSEGQAKVRRTTQASLWCRYLFCM